MFCSKRATLLALLGASAVSAASATAGAQWPAQLTPTSLGNVSLPVSSLVTFGTGIIGGRPNAGTDPAKARIGILVMHAEQDYPTFYPCSEFPVRGYTTLCLNNAQSKTGLMNDLDFETLMTDVGAGVQFLKDMDEIDRVIIWGHSGGGAKMAAYQDVAEDGASACNGTEKIYPCSSAMDALEPADGAANLYSPANGWTESGANCTSSFVREFYAAVDSRWNDLVDSAVKRNKLIQSRDAAYTDDEGLVITDANYIGFNNKIISQDTRFLSHTTYKWPLLHKGNRTTRQIVPSVRVPSAGIPSDTNNFYNGALKTTVTRFLSTFAIRIDPEDLAVAADSINGVDWASSQTAPIAVSLGSRCRHYEYINAEKTYLAATKARDKSVAFAEEARHTINTCTECERYPGGVGDTVRTAFDYMDAWLWESGRFVAA